MPSDETKDGGALSSEELRGIDAYWRAANYLSVGQIYLYDNPLLKQPLRKEHVKPRLLGHWGTTPGLNFIYAHLNRVIRAARSLRDLHHRPGPRRTGDGRERLARGHVQRGLPEHLARRRGDEATLQAVLVPRRYSEPRRTRDPGSIHEGGELGYALSHAYGAAFDNPDLIVACVIGDGEAETGPLATSWHSNKFLNPAEGRRGPAHPALERLQDREPHGARAHQPRGARPAPPRLWLSAPLRRGRRAGGDASPDGRNARGGDRGDPAHPGRRPNARESPGGRAGR